MPDENEIRSIVNDSVYSFINKTIPPMLVTVNEYILNYARFNLTSQVTYQPDFFSLPPFVTNNSADFYAKGDVFMNQVGFQNIQYPDVNLIFDNSTQADLGILVSPQFLRTIAYNLIMSFQFYDDLSKQIPAFNFDQVRIDKITPNIRDP